MVLGFLRRKKNKEADFPEEVTEPLPDDLEKFRIRESEPQAASNYPTAAMNLVNETERRIESEDKMDLILQKLETIDVRLKLLEEKLGV